MHLSALHRDDFKAFVTFMKASLFCLIIVKHDSLLHMYGILIVQMKKLGFRTTCRKRPRHGQDRKSHVNRTCRQNAVLAGCRRFDTKPRVLCPRPSPQPLTSAATACE